MHRKLNNGKADFYALGARRHRRSKHERVGIRNRAVEVVLRKPDCIQADALCQLNFFKSAVYNRAVLIRMVAYRKYKRTDSH